MSQKKRYLILPTISVSVALATLTGCSADPADPPAQINNAPSAAEQADGESTASPGSSPEASRDDKTASRVMEITDKTAETAPKLLRESNRAVQTKIVEPLYSGETKAMQWITLLALGARVDGDSITTDDDGLFTAKMVDPESGEVLAEVTGVMRGESIKPTNYQETGAGEDYRSAHVSESRKWATN